MNVTLEAGQFGWDYLLVFSDGKDYLVQSDQEYPAAAKLFGWDDATDNLTTSANYIHDAQEYLDDHIGETVEVDPGEPLYEAARPSERAAHYGRSSARQARPAIRSPLPVLIKTVAVIFSNLLRQQLSSSVMRRIIQDNRNEQSRGVCHTHDHIDANEVMDEAIHEAVGRGWDGLGDDDRTSLWNAAWELAKRNEFDADAIGPVSSSAPSTELIGAPPLTFEFLPTGVRIKHDGNLDEDEIRRIREMGDNAALGELFEYATVNGIIEWISPNEVGAETEAPMFALADEVEVDDDGNLTSCDRVYIYNDYQTTRLVDDIFEPEGAFLKLEEVNFRASRTDEVVKDEGFALEGEWEKDER